ncbi:hypothetical protein [Tessaracoccus sp.]
MDSSTIGNRVKSLGDDLASTAWEPADGWSSSVAEVTLSNN